MKAIKNNMSGDTKHCMKPKYARLKQAGKSIAVYLNRNGGFGMNELLGIAAALIIAAFIIIPGLRRFAGNIMTELENWWKNTIVSQIFSS